MINYQNELFCSFIRWDTGKETVMNRGQQSPNPYQGSYNSAAPNGSAAPNPGGYAYPGQNSGRQQASAGYFSQNAYGQGNGWNPQQGGAVQNPQMGYVPQGGNMQNTQQYGYGPQGGAVPQSDGYYAPNQGGYPPRNAPNPAAQGYPAGAGYQSAAFGTYPQMGQTGGYAQQAPYAAGSGGYAQQQGNSGGQYIPQTPYGNGYAQQGYAYSQGYAPYQQMGRAPEPGAAGAQPMTDSARQIPLNGAGYVPQPVPVRKAPFRLTDTWLAVISALILILFAAGMFAPGLSALKWVFLILAACSIAALWIRPMTAKNKRLCYTIVMAVLCVVAAVSLATGGARAPGNRTQTTPPPQTTAAANTSSADLSGGIVLDGQSGQQISSIPAEAAMETPKPEDNNAVVERMESFFYYWSANQIDEMLTLCSPNWQSSQENPLTSLFALMANRTPKELTAENITGTNDDQSRTITISVLMDRKNGKPAVKYRMNVMMVKENDQWYVDPQSLKSNDPVETENPDDAATPSPSPTPAVNGGTVLYYNPDGGTKYHLDPNCKSTHEKFLPFKGHFTYAEVNDEPYASLSPCNVCAAPLREQ